MAVQCYYLFRFVCTKFYFKESMGGKFALEIIGVWVRLLEIQEYPRSMYVCINLFESSI